MRGRRRRDLPVFAAIVVAFALLARVTGRGELEPPVLPSLDALAVRAAPDFELPALRAPGDVDLPEPDGGSRRLVDYAGRVLFLNFWATWCEPCREELPALEALHRELAGEGLAVVGVSVDGGRPDAVSRFAARRGLSFSLLHDADEAVARRYGVIAYPTSVVVDRAGRVVHAAPGAWNWSDPDSVAWLRGLLAQ